MSITTIQHLPYEMLAEIFQFLSKDDLSNCCRVNTLWNSLASSNATWSYFAKTELENPKLGNDTSFKTMMFFAQYKMKSNDEIIERLQRFLNNRCSLDENCQFTCVLGLGFGSQHLTVKIINRSYPSNQIDVRETFYSVSGIGDQALKFIPPAPPQHDRDLYLDSYKADLISEPDYSDPEKPKQRHYAKMDFRFLEHEMTVIIPCHQLDHPRSPMLLRIEQIVTSKCIEYVKTEPRLIKAFLSQPFVLDS